MVENVIVDLLDVLQTNLHKTHIAAYVDIILAGYVTSQSIDLKATAQTYDLKAGFTRYLNELKTGSLTDDVMARIVSQIFTMTDPVF